ncbi:hypothetical protein CCE01nite_13680 [Cellulomonas cellasea]|uniref:Uncharacterized protein n=1 Tax=Cellulomonas cellasea TaxID=43670 RepID=A0A4Y3KSL6_9CELL|nr:hypothetical protein CCE01nite_13680 [Cellulomonas cellasea]
MTPWPGPVPRTRANLDQPDCAVASTIRVTVFLGGIGTNRTQRSGAGTSGITPEDAAGARGDRSAVLLPDRVREPRSGG